jgi:nicotinamidase-related amidase
MAIDTAVLLIDPYNDFLHSKGKLNPAVAESLTHTGTIEHLKELVTAARKHKIPIFYGLHQQIDAHSFHDWQFMNESLARLKSTLPFEKGSWGAEIYEGLEPNLENGDVVVSKHWNSRYSNGPV